jgi:ribonuclease P protein component
MWLRLVHSTQFKALLDQPQRWRSTHFAVHHAPSAPSMPRRVMRRSGDGKLSTGGEEQLALHVDKLPDAETPLGHWWASVVPKRHARRAVTRNLIDRQIQAALQRAEGGLAPGQWLLRLRAPWPREQYRSADSSALRSAVRTELDKLLARCQQRVQASRSAC